jgi:hypothetical protein
MGRSRTEEENDGESAEVADPADFSTFRGTLLDNV